MALFLVVIRNGRKASCSRRPRVLDGSGLVGGLLASAFLHGCLLHVDYARAQRKDVLFAAGTMIVSVQASFPREQAYRSHAGFLSVRHFSCP